MHTHSSSLIRHILRASGLSLVFFWPARSWELRRHPPPFSFGLVWFSEIMEIHGAISESDDRRLKTKYNNAIKVIRGALALYSWVPIPLFIPFEFRISWIKSWLYTRVFVSGLYCLFFTAQYWWRLGKIFNSVINLKTWCVVFPLGKLSCKLLNRKYNILYCRGLGIGKADRIVYVLLHKVVFYGSCT